MDSANSEAQFVRLFHDVQLYSAAEIPRIHSNTQEKYVNRNEPSPDSIMSPARVGKMNKAKIPAITSARKPVIVRYGNLVVKSYLVSQANKAQATVIAAVIPAAINISSMSKKEALTPRRIEYPSVAKKQKK